MTIQKKISLCFVGSMLGQNAGFVTTQGQITADLFASVGYQVICVSSKVNKIARLWEIASTLFKNRQNFDLVLLEVYSGLSFVIADVASLICKIFRVPLIMVLHGGNLPEFIEKYPHWTKRVLRRAHSLVAPSPYLARKIGAHGFDINVVSNVVKLESYSFRERSNLSPNLLWMRSFHPIYNPQMAIKVLAELQKFYPSASLTMAGVDKGLEPELKKMVSEMDLSAAICFPGFLDAEKKANAFQKADIFLNTNRTDNMPVSVIEACACGLPVVATNVGGLPDLISNRENGLLVKNEDVGEMTKAVKSLLENPKLAKKISRNGRVLAERSGWASVRVRWEKLFTEVLERKVENSQTNFISNDLTT